MKKTTFLIMVCLSVILTACGKQSEIPPVDLIEIPVSTTETEIPPQTETLSPIPASSDIAETETIPETSVEVTETISLAETVASTTTLPEITDSLTTDEEEETETTTEAKPKNAPWVKAYRKVLAEHCEDSEEESETSDEDSEDDDDDDFDDENSKDDDENTDNEWFVLIYLDDDDTPELVILDDTDMELYCFDGKNAQLLLEDSYKSDALDGQNVCYQPYTGYIASAFTTMSGGDGFTIYHFDQLDAVHVQRYYFNNIENVDGEMAYNEIWDRADEFEVIDNGYHDVTLGDSWTHITSEMKGAFRLNSENVSALTADLAPDIDVSTEEDPTEETKEDEE